MPIKFCVYGEGPNDFGVIDKSTDELKIEGCYAAFTKKASKHRDFECVDAGRFPVGLPGGKKKKKMKSWIKSAKYGYFSALEAVAKGATWLIIGCDVDFDSVKKMSDLRKGFLKGYNEAIKINSSVGNVRLITIVPLVELESWLIADETAFKKATGIDRGVLPDEPEKIMDVKERFHKMFEASRRKPPGTKVYSKIAREASPEILKTKCPNSYPPFFDSIPV